MNKLTLQALRVVLCASFVGTVVLQIGIVWVLASGSDPEDGTAALTAVRVCALVGLIAVQVGLVCVLRLLAMVLADTVFTTAAFRYVDVLSGAIVAAALVWFVITAVNAPGQRDDPGVTAIMAGIGVGILAVALIVRVLRMLLTQAIHHIATSASGRD